MGGARSADSSNRCASSVRRRDGAASVLSSKTGCKGDLELGIAEWKRSDGQARAVGARGGGRRNASGGAGGQQVSWLRKALAVVAKAGEASEGSAKKTGLSRVLAGGSDVDSPDLRTKPG